MAKQEFLLTFEGAQALRQELEELRGPRRQDLAKRLKHAVEMGDLSENADYIAAKEEQAFLEGRIQELETVLREATIVESAAVDGLIGVGSTVTVTTNAGTPETFKLVGVKEANSRQGKISHESPIGKALMGKRAGETAQAQTPAGTMEIEILTVE